jgi:hypothetical protein
MLKTGMIRPGIDEVGKAKLFYVSQPLEPGMLNQVKYKITRDAYESINGIINYFTLIFQIRQRGNN